MSWFTAGHRSIGCHACSRRNAWSSSTSGNAAANRSAQIGLIAITTSPFSPVPPRNMLLSGNAMLLAMR